MALITLLTDFGPGRYVAAMKAVILSIHPEATLVDVEHDISPQGVMEGAFVLASFVRYAPQAVHVAVVDPGVGTERRPLVVACSGGLLVGPDNGLLMPAAQALGLAAVYEITNEAYCLAEISDTFHGRDIFAPVAAHLGRGVSPDAVGPPVKDPVTLDFGRYEATEGSLTGRILFEDRFGNLISNVPRGVLPAWLVHGAQVRLEAGGDHDATFVRSYAAAEAGSPVLTVSSEGYLEIAVSQGSAAAALGVGAGTAFRVRPR